MGALGFGGGTSLQMSNSASSRADAKNDLAGSAGSFGPRGVNIGTVGGIGSGGGISTGAAVIIAAGIAAAIFFIKR